jgi:hypothetical protein
MDASQRAFTEGNEENKDRIFGSIEKFLRYLRFLLLNSSPLAQIGAKEIFLQKATKETKICRFRLSETFVIFASFCKFLSAGADRRKRDFFYRRQLRKQRFAVFVF